MEEKEGRNLLREKEEITMVGYKKGVTTAILGAAFGGLIFGYDVGSTGRGLRSIPSGLKYLYPATQMEKTATRYGRYCKSEEEQTLGKFISTLYVASLLGSVLAANFTRMFPRKVSMFLGGSLVFCGSLLSGFANAYWMLIVGRVLISTGIDFTIQCLPFYVSETAPFPYRGALTIGFQLSVTIGIFVANVVNCVLTEIKDVRGWRLSLAGTMIPSFIITIGSFFLPEPHDQEGLPTPTPTKEVAHQRPAKELFMKRKYRPHLCMAVLIPCFQQLTGINVIMIYGPVLFRTVGFGAKAADLSGVITSFVNVISTLVSLYGVNKWGRRPLFIQGGVQMFICQVVVAIIFKTLYGADGEPLKLSNLYAITVVLFICLYVAAFAWSWGPLGWLVPNEIFPLEIRSTAQNLSVKVNLIVTFVIGLVFLRMHCYFGFWFFFFFSFWVLIMTTFIYYFFPETKGIKINDMEKVWETHKVWGRFVD